MKLETSQTNNGVWVKLENEAGRIIAKRVADLVTDQVYPAEIEIQPDYKVGVPLGRWSISKLSQFLNLCQAALTVANWLDQNIKTPGDFSRVDVPESIEDYQ